MSERRLIVNAADFGRSESANEAIVCAARDGVVTSASLMVLGDAAEDAARRLKECPELAVGLHFDAGEWARVGEEWITVAERFRLDDADASAEAVRSQLERFRELVGGDPTHIDAHQHVHRRPHVGRELRALARSLGIALHGAGAEITWLGLVDRDETGSIDDLERLLRLVASIPHGTTVITCHPDLPGAEGSPCCMGHATPLEALCDPSLRHAIASGTIRLVSFDEVARSRRRVASLVDTARTMLEQANAADAIARLEQAVDIDPEEPLAWLLLARALGESGDGTRAQDAASRALALRPGWPRALWQLASLRWQAGDRAATTAAVAELCSASRLDSRVGTHARIALHALRSGCSRDVVVALLETPLAFDEETAHDAVPPMELGRRAFHRGELELAEQLFAGVEQADGVRPWTSLWLARTFRAAGRTAEAFAALASGLALGDDREMLGIELADHLAAAGERDRAIWTLEALHKRNPASAQLAATIARRLIDLGEHERAATIAGACAAQGNDLCRVSHAIAEWHLGNAAPAEQLLDEASSPLGPGDRAELALAVSAPLVAWRELRDAPPERTGSALLHRTAHALRRNGHLSASLEAFRASQAAHANGSADWIAKVDGEITLLSGSWTPPRIVLPPIEPLPGRVLNVVGKSLPHTQSGYTIRTQYVARTQREIGLEPHLVTQLGFPWTVGVDDAADCDLVDGIPCHRLLPSAPIPERLDALTTANTIELARLVARVRPSVMLAASDFRNPLMAIAVGRQVGIPVIYSVRGFWQETWLSKRSSDALESEAYRWRGDRELECMRAATHVVTIAETMKAQLLASGIPEEKITVIPNAVDTDEFHRVDPDPLLARALGIEEGEAVLGYISSFASYEGIVHLIDAAAILIERGHRVRVLLVGDGEERRALEERARLRGIADRVIFTGRVPHDRVLEYYGVIDLFVVPRTNDRVSQLVTPLKPYEAMATERVVIVSGVPALREMIVEGRTGLSFTPEDAHDLARVAEPLLGDRDRRRELGRAAREWVVANRTWRANGGRMRETYELLDIMPATARAT